MIVLAPDLDSYPAPSHAGEADLIPVIRVEPCACGEYVRQFAGDDLPSTVARHNGTMAHRAWRYQP